MPLIVDVSAPKMAFGPIPQCCFVKEFHPQKTLSRKIQIIRFQLLICFHATYETVRAKE